MIESVASNPMKKKEKEGIVELYYDFQKAYDNVNHSFLEKLLDVYGFPPGVQMLIIEMMSRWKIRLSYGRRKKSEKSDWRTASSKAMHSRPPLCLDDRSAHQDHQNTTG